MDNQQTQVGNPQTQESKKSDTTDKISDGGLSVMESSFGTGINEKVLLVTKGVSVNELTGSSNPKQQSDSKGKP